MKMEEIKDKKNQGFRYSDNDVLNIFVILWNFVVFKPRNDRKSRVSNDKDRLFS